MYGTQVRRPVSPPGLSPGASARGSCHLGLRLCSPGRPHETAVTYGSSGLLCCTEGPAAAVTTHSAVVRIKCVPHPQRRTCVHFCTESARLLGGRPHSSAASRPVAPSSCQRQWERGRGHSGFTQQVHSCCFAGARQGVPRGDGHILQCLPLPPEIRR